MSTPPLQRRGCIDKIRHRSEKSAWAAIKRMRRDGHDEDHRLRAYRCVYCRGWHLGHPSTM